VLGRLLQSHLSTFNYAPLATSLAEAEVLSRLFNRSATVLQQPVSALFFAAPRQEDRKPNVLADGTDAVDKVTRLCVLLNGRGARVRFSWLGTGEGSRRAQLEAANIRVLRATDDSDRARALSCAWLFVQMSRHAPSPVGVAQAMAAAVPCLVSDIPAHRALIRHGETGFVCTSERDLLESVLLLLRDSSERKRIGEAARAEAMRRFTEQGFQRALLRAYGFSVDDSMIPVAN
jgi:glycosyltransferase involved in cell wall biosynthesis